MDTPTEFELGDKRRDEEEAEKQQREEGEGSQVGGNSTIRTSQTEEGMTKKRPRI